MRESDAAQPNRDAGPSNRNPCGDGVCSAGESCGTCPLDCPCSADCAWVAEDTGPPTEHSLTETARSMTVGGLTVDYVDFPLPAESPNYSLWSMWGEGEIASDGRFYASVGDHGSVGGNAYLYQYDPTSMRIRLVSDVMESFDGYQSGSFGYGKVHGQVDEGPCGALYFHTYRGSTRGEFSGSYRGDLLLRFNPASGHTTVLGETLENWQTPSTNLWREGGILYGEANTFGRDAVRFWAYDLASGERFTADPVNRSNRNIAIDGQGRAYFGEGPLFRYDPSNGEVTQVPGYPGGVLRASTRTRADGSMVMITDRGNEAYLFGPEAQTFEHIASMTGYVASVALDAGGDSFYVVPGAHGGRDFTVERFTIADGSRTELGTLMARIQADNPSGLGPCSTYGIHSSLDGTRLYMAANATTGPPDDCLNDTGGEGAMVIAVHLQ